MRGFAAGGGGPDMHGYFQKSIVRGGQRYYQPGVVSGGGGGNVTPTKDKLYASPLMFSRDTTVTTFCVFVSGARAGSLTRLGIYNAISPTATPAGANTYPNALLYDSGDVDTHLGGLKTVACGYTCLKNVLYWSTFLTNDGGGGVDTFDYANDWATWSLLGYLNVSSTPKQGWQATQAYGALPATFPTVGSTALYVGRFPAPWYTFT